MIPSIASTTAKSSSLSGAAASLSSVTTPIITLMNRKKIHHVSYPHLTVSKAIDLLRGSSVVSTTSADDSLDFRLNLLKILRDVPYQSIFWECKPVSLSTMDTQPFEFVIIEASALDDVSVDLNPFSKQFKKEEGGTIATFLSLGKDSLLLSPKPLPEAKDLQSYAHLKRFIDNPNLDKQQLDLLTRVGESYHTRLAESKDDAPVWLSTSGLGVYYLHVRLDSYPKYYNFAPYKKWQP